MVPRGCGSSYGDAATCSGGLVIDMTARRELLHLDVHAGIAVAEAGLTIGSLLSLTAPHGWRPPVLPGTPHVTLGGAVAADIHGKNHPAAGSLGRHVEWLVVVSGDLRPRLLSPDQHPDEFWATVGGLGLTGPILIVALRLAPLGTGAAVTRRVRAGTVAGVMALLSAATGEGAHEVTETGSGPRPDVHAVAWLDGHGRGLVDVTTLPRPPRPAPSTAGDGDGRAADDPVDWPPTRRLRSPTTPAPSAFGATSHRASLPGTGVITRATVRAAGRLRWAVPGRAIRSGTPSAAVFPLRHAGLWPALFGEQGLLQYQFVVPTDAASVVTDSLALLARRRLPPALATLKRLGACDPAPLGFAMPGWTLAVDLPARWSGLGAALDDLDRLVLEAGGRVYLAKDLRLGPDHVQRMYPGLDAWRRTREAMDPDHLFGSDLSRRLHLTTTEGDPR